MRLNKPIAIICSAMLIIATVPFDAQAVDRSEFETIGTHPQASEQPTLTGKRLNDLAFDSDGNIISVYGDYGANTGPIHINPFNPTTEQFTGSVLEIPTEESQTIRQIDGALYTTMDDPRLPWDQPVTGYATDASGSWANVGAMSSVHIYDILKDSQGNWWTVGSGILNPGGSPQNIGAIVYRSTNDGATWTVMFDGDYNGPGGSGTGTSELERYYWIAELNGKIYIQASSVIPRPPTRVYDLATGTWSDNADNLCISSYAGKYVTVFDGKIFCRTYNQQYQGLQYFDGVNPVAYISLPHADATEDFYTDGDRLYILGTSGTVSYLTAGSLTPQLVTTQAIGAKSLAVRDGYVYLGMFDATIRRSVQTVSDMPRPEPEVFGYDGATIRSADATHVVTLEGWDFTPGVTATIGGVSMPVERVSNGSLQITIDVEKLIREGTLGEKPEVDHGGGGGSTVTMAISTMMAALVLDASAPDRYYDLVVTNPSGLSTTEPGVISVLGVAVAAESTAAGQTGAAGSTGAADSLADTGASTPVVATLAVVLLGLGVAALRRLP